MLDIKNCTAVTVEERDLPGEALALRSTNFCDFEALFILFKCLLTLKGFMCKLLKILKRL